MAVGRSYLKWRQWSHILCGGHVVKTSCKPKIAYKYSQNFLWKSLKSPIKYMLLYIICNTCTFDHIWDWHTIFQQVQHIQSSCSITRDCTRWSTWFVFGGHVVQNIPAFKHVATDPESGCTLTLGLHSPSGTALGITRAVSRIQGKEENAFSIMASKFKITSN
jgi:hypothetical protein